MFAVKFSLGFETLGASFCYPMQKTMKQNQTKTCHQYCLIGSSIFNPNNKGCVCVCVCVCVCAGGEKVEVTSTFSNCFYGKKGKSFSSSY